MRRPTLPRPCAATTLRRAARFGVASLTLVAGTAVPVGPACLAQDVGGHPEPTRPTLADVRLAISIGEAPSVETYVVLGAATPGVGPVVSQRLDLDRYATTRAAPEASLTDAARAALAENWVVHTASGETCAGKLGSAVVLELVDAYDTSDGTMALPDADGELGVSPYTFVLAAPLEAECATDARFALPEPARPALVLRRATGDALEGEAARRLVLRLPIHAELADTFRAAAVAAGTTPDGAEAEIVTTLRAVADDEHGVRGWIVSVAYGSGCGDGIASLWALVVETGSGPEVRAVGRELDTPSLVLDLDGDGELEVVHEYGLRRVGSDVLPPLAITRSPPGCMC